MESYVLQGMDWSAIGTALGTVLSGIIIAFLPRIVKYIRFRNKVRHEFSLDSVLENIKSGKVYETLFKLREECNASRVRVCKFHNGGNFLDGSQIKKFSATHETCAAGISIQALSLQNVQFTLFIDLLRHIRNNQPVILSVDEIPDGSSLKTWKTQHHVTHFSVLPVRCKDFTSGFIVIEWNEFPKEINLKNFAELFVNGRDSLEIQLIDTNE